MWQRDDEAGGRLARDSARHGSFADPGVRASMHAEHESLYRLIEAGDARGAEQAVRDHYTQAEAGKRQHGFRPNAPINARSLKV